MTLEEAATYIEENMGKVWGGKRHWLTTGDHVASLMAEVLRDLARGTHE